MLEYKPGHLTTERSDILQFEKRSEARQNEIRDGSVAGVVYHKRHNTGESAIEGQRKAGSRSQSPKGLVRLTNAATPSQCRLIRKRTGRFCTRAAFAPKGRCLQAQSLWRCLAQDAKSLLPVKCSF